MYSMLILMLTLFLGKVIWTGPDNVLLGVTEKIFPDKTKDADQCLFIRVTDMYNNKHRISLGITLPELFLKICPNWHWTCESATMWLVQNDSEIYM